jgi:hypothetical protein
VEEEGRLEIPARIEDEPRHVLIAALERLQVGQESGQGKQEAMEAARRYRRKDARINISLSTLKGGSGEPLRKIYPIKA